MYIYIYIYILSSFALPAHFDSRRNILSSWLMLWHAPAAVFSPGVTEVVPAVACEASSQGSW